MMAVGCGQPNKGEKFYFLLVGNVAEYYDTVEVGNIYYGKNISFDKVPSAGAEGDFSFEVYFDGEKVEEYTGYGVQIPLDHDDPTEVKVVSNSGNLVVYVSVQDLHEDPQKNGVGCVFKEKVSAKENPTITFDFQQLKNRSQSVFTTP